MAAQRRGDIEVGCAHNGRARERCFKLPNECSANTDNAEEEKNGRKRKEDSVRSGRTHTASSANTGGKADTAAETLVYGSSGNRRCQIICQYSFSKASRC